MSKQSKIVSLAYTFNAINVQPIDDGLDCEFEFSSTAALFAIEFQGREDCKCQFSPGDYVVKVTWN